MSQEFVLDWSGRSVEYSQAEIDAVVGAMKGADPLTQGGYLSKFQKDFAAYSGSKHCFGVANCTNALDLSALLSGLGPGDEVIIPAHTFCASAIPFARTGATLRWGDIDPDTRVLSKESVEKLINSRTKVIVPVHLYGLMVDMDPILELARIHGSYVVEDCAQAIGAEYKDAKAGTLGDFGTFSFHGQKSLTTLGEGGVLTVKSDEHASLVPGLRHNGCRPFEGLRESYWRPAMSNVDIDLEGVWPYNFCISETQCALGSEVLKTLDSQNDRRIQRAKHFISSLKEFPELSFQAVGDDFKHVYHLLSARYDSPGNSRTNHDLIALMGQEFRIKCIVQYYPLYRYPLFAKMGFSQADCPHTDSFFDNMISFPFHLWMSDEDFDYMTESTIRALRQLRT